MLGLIGQKVGMTQVFDKDGHLIPVTAIKIEGNVVVAERTEEKNGYSAVLLGAVDMKEKATTKPYKGQFKDITAPKKHLQEFRDFEKEVKVGDTIGVDLFNDITYVDVTGISKGKGYQGGIKRHGFHGGRATHGSKFHRDLGGTAMSSTPARTFKGQKMAGHMGNEQKTIQNLRIVRVDEEAGLLLVKGAIPGSTKSTVVVKKAVKK